MNLPGDTQRIVIVGATGSGKTQAASWSLSKRNFTEKPWVVYDFKYDELLNSIEGIQEIDVTQPAPIKPGLYIAHPTPDQTDAVSAQMWDIWQRENIGVYIDEAGVLGLRNDGYRALLTQGRSKHIPMIICTQRPAWIDLYTFSEASFIQVFRLSTQKDVGRVQEYISAGDISRRLPEFWSYYYDVAANQLAQLRPVPDARAILDTFNTKLRVLRKVL